MPGIEVLLGSGLISFIGPIKYHLKGACNDIYKQFALLSQNKKVTLLLP
jgi:hypothetical protein